jgi:adhesin transport system outer membrane protein
MSSSLCAAVPDNNELVAVVARVVDTHPTVKSARAELAAAESELSASKLARLPSVTVETFTDNNHGGSVANYISLEQPLWAAGRIDAGIDFAKARMEAAKAGVDEAALNVALRTSDAYVEYLRLQARAQILAEGVEQHQRLVDSIKRRVEQEVSPNSDADYAMQRLLSIQQDQVQNKVTADLMLSRLRELSGVENLVPKGVLRYSSDQHQIRTDGLLRAAIDYNPRERRLRAEVDAAKADTAIRKAQIWPQLNAQALHYSGSSYQGLKDRLGLVLRLQTDGGFARLAAARAAGQREESARAAAEAGIRDLREQVVADISENTVAASRIDTGHLAATAARTVTDSYLRQFTAGRRSWPEVLNVVREEVSARISEVDAEASAVASAMRLQLRSGEWRPADSAAGK